MRLIYLPLCMATLMLCGCNKNAQSADEKEERNPLVKTGLSYVENKEWDKAEEAFKQAIENNPKMAHPHLDLAMIYHRPGNSYMDYVKAIYHYDRYLELRPDSEKATMINQQKMKVAQDLSTALVKTSPDVKALVGERNRLQQENVLLRRQIATLKQTDPTQSVAATSTNDKPSLVKRTVTEPRENPQHQIYTVVAGDTLTKIAKKFYGSDDYDPIYEANKDRMKGPGDLRIGQTLIIPKQ